MKHPIRELWVFCLVLLLSALLSFYPIFYNGLRNQNEAVKVGNEYLFSYRFNTKNPFEKINVDTVKVINIQKGYVQYVYKNGIIMDEELEFFKHWTKPIN